MEKDNRNPYHIYADLPKIKEISDDIFYRLDTHQYEIPYKDKFVICDRDWFLNRGGNKERTFNYSLTKGELGGGNGLSFPSLDFSGEIKTYIHKEKCKLKKDGTPYIRKKGNPKFNKRTNQWEYEYMWGVYQPYSTDIQSFFELLKEYRQISCGLTHKERQIIVCDYDEDYTDDTLSRLEKICEDNNIPHFTYLERHMDSNHYQIGWILNKPFKWERDYDKDRKIFTLIKRSICLLFGSDKGFSGWNIKNPNCVHLTETQWFNDTIDKDTFVLSMKGVMEKLYNKEIKIPSPTEEISTDTSTSISDTTDTDITLSPIVEKPQKIIGRNEYLKTTLREWIWEYRRTNGDFPPFDITLKEGHRISKEVGIVLHKGTEESEKIYSTTMSVYNYCKKNYHPISTETIQTNSIFGNKIQTTMIKVKNIVDIYELKLKGYKNKEISKELHLSEPTICNHLKTYSFLFDYCNMDLIMGVDGLLYYLYVKEDKSYKCYQYINTLEGIRDKFYRLTPPYEEIDNPNYDYEDFDDGEVSVYTNHF